MIDSNRVKNNFIFPHNWLDLMAELDDHESMTLIRAIVRSHETGEIVDVGDDRLMKTIYRKMVDDVTGTDRAYEETCRKRRIQGAKGAAARWGKELTEEEIAKIAKEADEELEATGRKAVKMKKPKAEKPTEKPKGSLDASIFVSKLSEAAAKPETEPEPKPERHIQLADMPELEGLEPNVSLGDMFGHNEQEAI